VFLLSAARGAKIRAFSGVLGLCHSSWLYWGAGAEQSTEWSVGLMWQHRYPRARGPCLLQDLGELHAVTRFVQNVRFEFGAAMGAQRRADGGLLLVDPYEIVAQAEYGACTIRLQAWLG